VKIETKVGLLFLGGVMMVVAFAWLMGVANPFANTYPISVQYNFAGGLEPGSPVRLMGIKVGKVDHIDFVPDQKDSNGNEVKLLVHISVAKKARETITKGSQFYINLAGIIGEKFLEIVPGPNSDGVLEAGSTVRGVDPPRIDQLISQGYGVAGKVLEMLNKNEGSVTHTIELMDNLVTNLDKTLVQLDKTTKNVEITRLLKNITEISEDLRTVTSKVRTPEGKATLELIYKLLWRLEPMDREAIKEFLQKEGIRARIF
jgi:phospholipid/cholesterol/gamma-HCH transport system substrate-binding protein